MQTDREFSSVVQLPQFPGPSIVTRRNASEDPDRQTSETVHRMQAITIEDSSSPQVWAAMQGALHLQRTPGDCGTCEAIYRWIASHVRFRSDDPVLSHVLGLDNELDLLIRPARLLTMSRPAEDCDGFTMLCCSMLLAAGVPCEIVTIKADHDEPHRFSHVYCQALIENGQALVMDCSQGAQHGYPIGWEAPHYFDRKTWGVLHPQKAKGLHGLADYGDGTDLGYDAIDWVRGDPAGNAGSGFDWNSWIHQLTTGGLQIARMQSTPVGYVQTPTMTANYGPGGNIPFVGGAGGISSNLLLIGGGLLLAAVIFGSKK